MSTVDKETYLLDLLQEEAAEIIQASSKCIRFGPNDFWYERGISNTEYLVNEINDLFAVIKLLQLRGILPENTLDDTKIKAKLEKVGKYIEYSRRIGTLED